MQEDFSRMLKIARKQAGLTQKALADILGVATGTVQQWELGIRFPRVAMLQKIEETLKIAIVPSDVEEEKKQRFKKTMNDAWKAAEKKAGRKLSFDEAMEFYKFDVAVKMKLENTLSKLNNEGIKVALERVEELTLIEKYTLPDINLHPSYFDAERYVMVPFDELQEEHEKPPQGNQTPHDGK